MTTITINSTDFSVDAQGNPLRVIAIWWTPYLTQSGVTESLYGHRSTIPSSYAPANIAYSTVTEANCVAWVTALETANGNAASPPYDYWAEIDRQLNAKFSAIAQPKTGSGLPWQSAYPLWVVPKAYAINDIVVFEDIGYVCVQSHTSQIDWQPPLVPALWTPYVPASQGPQPWVQPLGSFDAYQIGEQVTHNGHLWECTIADNVWEPGVIGWLDLGLWP
jgi:hypothetical protein